MIQVPPSYHKTLSNAIQDSWEMQGLDIVEGDVWGHRKDLDEYYTVDETILNEINALAAGGATAEDVADQIQKKSQNQRGSDQVSRQGQNYRLESG